MKRLGTAFIIAMFLGMPQALLADQGTEAWVESDVEVVQQGAPANQDLLATVNKLNKRVEELEAKLAEKGAAVSESDRLKLVEDRLSAQEKLAASGGPGFSLDNLPSGNFLKNTKITGFVDASYTFNFNQPSALSNNSNGGLAAANLHAFDRGSNDFSVQMVQIQLNKDAVESDPIGYNVKLDYGDDAEVIGAAGLGSTADEFDLQQAYIAYRLPFEKMVNSWPWMEGWSGNIMGGKYATWAGAEVIESKDNWNFSRSFLFGLAIPFTHTGVRTNWNYKGWLDTGVGLNNGWDVFDDNNQAKTLEFRLGATPTPWGIDWTSANLVYIFGAEQANKSGNHRNLLDLVLTVKNPLKGKAEHEGINKYLDKATLMFNMDWATEQNATRFDEGGISSVQPNTPANGGLLVHGTARWHGYATYLKYELFPWWTIANRLEFFQDTDGSRSLRQQDLWEYTLTNQFNIIDNLITRIEYRHDGADKPIFGKGYTGTTGQFVSGQDIVYLEAIYSF